MKDDSFDCTLIAHLRIFLLFYRLLYCLILPENRLFFGIWKVVEIEREVKTPTMETFVKLLNVLGAEPNEVLKEVSPLTRMEHTSVVEGKLERLTPKKQESVLRMLDVIIEEMMK